MSPPTSTPCSKAGAWRRLLTGRLAWVAAGVILTLAAFGIGGLVVIEGGLFDATAVTPHGRLMGWATHTTMIHVFQRRAKDVEAPSRFSAAQVGAGLRLYDDHCAMCHGGPGVARARWTSGLTPTPPYLTDAARQWTPAELRAIVADGVKMTAMPAWSTSLSSDQIWDLVAFVEAMPGVSATTYAQARAAPSPASARTP